MVFIAYGAACCRTERFNDFAARIKSTFCPFFPGFTYSSRCEIRLFMRHDNAKQGNWYYHVLRSGSERRSRAPPSLGIVQCSGRGSFSTGNYRFADRNPAQSFVITPGQTKRAFFLRLLSERSDTLLLFAERDRRNVFSAGNGSRVKNTITR